ncbi:MAG: helix-turn-helix domain-containing protein [Halomonas sp.]
MGKSRSGASQSRAAQRRAEAMRYRLTGLSYDGIAKRLGCSRSQAHRLVTKELQELAKQAREDAEAVREMELARLDRLQQALWEQATDDGNHGAVDRLLRVMERRAKLLGLDAPQRVAPTQPDGEQPWAPQYMSEEERAQRVLELLQSAGYDPEGGDGDSGE